ncbi:methyl-accepting chemotaxis protein [Bacillus sp. HMF5848]|uniref:methyl-accepting chemotaxis protein n=1 Tax=Bacillus sp. HMF5848 TaxID=2495421 RepID=UPI0037C12490
MEEVATGSEQQVLSVSKVNSIALEISSGMGKVASTIHSVALLAGNTNEKATSGNQVVTQTIEQMNTTQAQVTDTAKVVNQLGIKSKEIGQIVELITQIANQTNLLALNAAIEASRAGEHGKGFAVVADEVRKLAEQSGSAAEDIQKLVSQIQNEANNAIEEMNKGSASVSESIQMVHKSGFAFKEIVDMVMEISSQTQDVSAVIKEVHVGSKEMVEKMEEVGSISQQTAENSQSVAAASEEQSASMQEVTSSASSLSYMAEELQTLVSRFKI